MAETTGVIQMVDTIVEEVVEAAAAAEVVIQCKMTLTKNAINHQMVKL